MAQFDLSVTDRSGASIVGRAEEIPIIVKRITRLSKNRGKH